MSYVRDPYTVKQSHWLFMACVMVEKLDGAEKRGSLGFTDFPINVLRAAIEFLSSALEASGDRVPEHPSADIANYTYACDALKTGMTLEMSREEIKTRLDRFYKFLTTLPRPSLTDDDIKLVREMAEFFGKLRDNATTSQYDEFFTEDECDDE